jgi:hypothetical protein
MTSKPPLPREANYVGQNQTTRLTPAQSRRTKHKEQLGKTGGPLLSQQFQPMSAIERMGSVDAGSDAMVGEDLIPEKQEQVEEGQGDTEDYPALIEAMKTGGVKSIPPVHVDTTSAINRSYGSDAYSPKSNMSLGNGGHRTAIAHDLGWKVMPVTPYKDESGYGDEEFGKQSYGEGSSGWRDSSGSQQSASNAASSAGSSSASPSSSLHPGDRSYIPGVTGGRDPARRWHAHGRDGAIPPGEGLYSQIHGPAPHAAAAPLSNLSPMQFGRTNLGQPTWQRAIKSVVAERNNVQPVLPGMDHYGAQYGSHEWSGGNASEGPMETHFPGGGRIQTADRGSIEQHVIRARREAVRPQRGGLGIGH